MKPFIRIGVLAIFLFACQRHEEERNTIRQVSTNWDEAYTAVHSLERQLEEARRFCREKCESMQYSAEELALLDEDTRKQMSDYREACRQQSSDLDAITRQVRIFTIIFDEETGRLEELENQLEEGLRIERIDKKAAQFQSNLSEILPKVATWQRHLENIRENCRHSCDAYHRLAANGREN